MYGSGGSHGGDGGAEDSTNQSPPSYGSFIDPTMFGSAGGDADINNKGIWIIPCTVKPRKFECRIFEILNNLK